VVPVLEGMKVNIEHEFCREKNAQVKSITQNNFCPKCLHNDIADRVKTSLASDNDLHVYVAGIPWRKVSIYNEGFLIGLAFGSFVFLILSEVVYSVFHLPEWYVFLLQLICMRVSSYFCHPPKDDFQISSPTTFYFSLI
jgi:hypothetical protein